MLYEGGVSCFDQEPDCITGASTHVEEFVRFTYIDWNEILLVEFPHFGCLAAITMVEFRRAQ